MRTVCSYCGRSISDDGGDPDRVSHGMCEPCFERFVRQHEGVPIGLYLDEFEGPVGLFDAECRLVAANQALAEMVGKPDRRLAGLLGGELWECANARQPGGCGKAERCEDCTLRATVHAVLRTGRDRLAVAVTVEREDGRLALRVSARLRGGVVQVTFTPAEGDPPTEPPPPS